MFNILLNKYFQVHKFPDEDKTTLIHNLMMHIGDGSMFLFAMHFVSVNMIMPVYVERIGGSAIAIGSVPVLWNMGMNLPQFFFSGIFKDKKQIKPTVVHWGFINRSMFLVIALFSFFILGRLNHSASVMVLLLLIFMTAVSGCVGVPTWYTLFSKTTPVKLKGRLQALRQFLGSLLGMLAGSLIIIILSSIAFPENFGTLFLICYFFMMISFGFLRRVKEPAAFMHASNDTLPIKRFIKAKSILKENKNFRNFLVSDALFLISITVFAFYAVYGIKKFNLPTSFAGTFTIIQTGSMIAANIIFGITGDKFGHKLNLLFLSFSSMTSSLIAVVAGNVYVFYLVFFFIACVTTIQGISRLAFIVEICDEHERPFVISLMNTITAPTLLFGIISGVLISISSYETVFILNSLVAAAACLWIIFKLKEPRKLKMNEAHVK